MAGRILAKEIIVEFMLYEEPKFPGALLQNPFPFWRSGSGNHNRCLCGDQSAEGNKHMKTLKVVKVAKNCPKMRSTWGSACS